MGAMKKLDHPSLYPGHTVWGSSTGPVVYQGDVERGNEHRPGIASMVNEREINETCIAFYGTSYLQVIERLAETEDRLAEAIESVNRLEAQLRDLGEQLTAADIVKKAIAEAIAQEEQEKAP